MADISPKPEAAPQKSSNSKKLTRNKLKLHEKLLEFIKQFIEWLDNEVRSRRTPDDKNKSKPVYIVLNDKESTVRSARMFIKSSKLLLKQLNCSTSLTVLQNEILNKYKHMYTIDSRQCITYKIRKDTGVHFFNSLENVIDENTPHVLRYLISSIEDDKYEVVKYVNRFTRICYTEDVVFENGFNACSSIDVCSSIEKAILKYDTFKKYHNKTLIETKAYDHYFASHSYYKNDTEVTVYKYNSQINHVTYYNYKNDIQLCRDFDDKGRIISLNTCKTCSNGMIYEYTKKMYYDHHKKYTTEETGTLYQINKTDFCYKWTKKYCNKSYLLQSYRVEMGGIVYCSYYSFDKNTNINLLKSIITNFNNILIETTYFDGIHNERICIRYPNNDTDITDYYPSGCIRHKWKTTNFHDDEMFYKDITNVMYEKREEDKATKTKIIEKFHDNGALGSKDVYLNNSIIEHITYMYDNNNIRSQEIVKNPFELEKGLFEYTTYVYGKITSFMVKEGDSSNYSIISVKHTDGKVVLISRERKEYGKLIVYDYTFNDTKQLIEKTVSTCNSILYSDNLDNILYDKIENYKYPKGIEFDIKNINYSTFLIKEEISIKCPVCYEDKKLIQIGGCDGKHKICGQCYKKTFDAAKDAHASMKCPLCRSYVDHNKSFMDYLNDM